MTRPTAAEVREVLAQHPLATAAWTVYLIGMTLNGISWVHDGPPHVGIISCAVLTVAITLLYLNTKINRELSTTPPEENR